MATMLCSAAAVAYPPAGYDVVNTSANVSIYDPLDPATLPVLGGFTVQFFAYAQMGPLAQEATAARRQRRSRAAIVGWTVFVGVILLLTASQFVLGSIYGLLGQLVVVATIMVVSAALYQGRTDFTR